LSARYLQNNCIDEIENLDTLSHLDTLNLEHNNISTIQNLACCPGLRTLHLGHNNLETVEDIEHLAECENVSVLDLSHNSLEDSEIIGVLEQMPNLSVLNLMGNDCVRVIRNYRCAPCPRFQAALRAPRLVGNTMRLELSGPLLEGLTGKRQYFSRERSRKLQTHRSSSCVSRDSRQASLRVQH
jgi:Leucine-rich repeat (LRR) protein